MANRLAKRLVCALAAVVLGSATLVVAQGTPKTYSPPRTPWGDPDLQGKWPGTDLVGVPLQRDPKFGTRNRLTEDEFKARQEQFAIRSIRSATRVTSGVPRHRRRTGSSAASRNTSRH